MENKEKVRRLIREACESGGDDLPTSFADDLAGAATRPPAEEILPDLEARVRRKLALLEEAHEAANRARKT